AQIEHLYGELLAQAEARHKEQVEELTARHRTEVEQFNVVLTQAEARHKEQVEELMARHRTEVEQFNAVLVEAEARHKAAVEELTAHYTSEIKHLQDRVLQINELLRARSISLAENETRAHDLQNRLRRQLQATKRLSRILDDASNAAVRLRSSLRWQIANPIAALKAKISPEKSKDLLGYGHLEKTVST